MWNFNRTSAAEIHPHSHPPFRNLVMKMFIYLLALYASAIAPQSAFANYTFPEQCGHVNDHLGILSHEKAEEMEKSLQAFKLETGIEIAVVTMSEEATGNLSVGEYTDILNRLWHVGVQYGMDTGGVLVLLRPRQKGFDVITRTSFIFESFRKGEKNEYSMAETIRRQTEKWKHSPEAAVVQAALTAQVESEKAKIILKKKWKKQEYWVTFRPFAVFLVIVLLLVAWAWFDNRRRSLPFMGAPQPD